MKRCRQGWSAQACRRPNGSGRLELAAEAVQQRRVPGEGRARGEPDDLVGVDQRQLRSSGSPRT